MEFLLQNWLTASFVILPIGAVIIWLWLVAVLRRVVPPNMVHIVQYVSKTVSYGGSQGVGENDNTAGNVYLEWPSWVPYWGVTVIKLPVSNFSLSLNDYEAFDRNRVPFRVNVMAFFRISNTNVAAQRVPDFNELNKQLQAILQGAARTVLASDIIQDIMLKRAEFGKLFTEEVQEQLKQWGVESVKNIELMDIRDTQGSEVIQNIMNIQESAIEMKSRMEVAENNRNAETAEIAARREVDLQKEQARQQVGERKASADQQIGVANEKAQQEIKTQKRETETRDMAVRQVNIVRTAEIKREQEVVAADEQRQTTIIKAEGAAKQIEIDAAAKLTAAKLDAEGIKAQGEAKATAEKLMQLAPVEAQIVLAKEIGENEGYQGYLVKLEGLKVQQAIGIAQAEALKVAEIKVIANGGTPMEGVGTVMNMFGPQGGTNMAGFLEALVQGDMGKALMERVGVKTEGDAPQQPPQASKKPEADKK